MKTPCFACDGLCCQDKYGNWLPHGTLTPTTHVCRECKDGFEDAPDRISLTTAEFKAMVDEIRRLRADVARLEAELRLRAAEPTTPDQQREYLDTLLGGNSNGVCYKDTDGEHCITEAEAIERQRAAGRRQGYEYPSDEAALADFMLIHWAWKDGETGWPKGKGGGFGYSV